MLAFLKRIFRSSSSGQSLIEYSLIIAFVAVAGYALFSGIADTTNGVWDQAGSTVDSAGVSAVQDGDTSNFHHSHSWWHGWGH